MKKIYGGDPKLVRPKVLMEEGSVPKPTTPPPDGSTATPAQLNFLHRLESVAIRSPARDDYGRWAEERVDC